MSADRGSVLHISARGGGCRGPGVDDLGSALFARSHLTEALNRFRVCHGVLSQCSHLSFECSGVLSHVCGHVTKVVKRKNKTKQGKQINEC